MNVIAGMDTNEKAWSILLGSYSSWFGTAGHSAVQKASKRVSRKMKYIAGHLLDVDPSTLELRDGRVHGPDGDSVR